MHTMNYLSILITKTESAEVYLFFILYTIYVLYILINGMDNEVTV